MAAFDSNECANSTLALQNDMLILLQTAKHSDVTFSVQGEKLRAHKGILATRCDYFSKMFDSSVYESSSNEVEVKDAKPEVFGGMLHYLYTNMLPNNYNHIALDLLVLADKYCLEQLKKICESSAPLNALNVTDALLVADQVGSSRLMARSKVVFQKNFDAIEISENFEDNPDLVLKLLSLHIRN